MLNTNGFFDAAIQMLKDASDKLFIPDECLAAIEVASSPRDVIACLDNYEYSEIMPKWLHYKEDKI